jgi:hypothetical protein
MEAAARAASKPVFGSPWTADKSRLIVRVPENTQDGYIVLVLPAFDPSNGNVEHDVTLTGDMADKFAFNSTTGCYII